MPVNPRGRSPIGDPIATPTTPGIMSAAQASQLAPTGAYLDISTATATIDGAYALYGVSYSAAGCTITLDSTNWAIGSTRRIEKMNTGTYVITVTPPSGGTINGGSADASLTLPGSTQAMNSARADGMWFITRTATNTWRIAGNVPYSGTYTPTFTAVTNLDSVVANGASMYTCVGNIVQVEGSCTIDPTTNALSQWGISLPIASNFAAATNASGGVRSGVAYVGWAYGDATNDRVQVDFSAAGTAALNVRFSFTYTVI